MDDRQQSTRQAYLETLGRLPVACPLDARVEEQVTEDGYTRSRITYDTSPGVRVPAYLFVPDGLTEPQPTVLCIHQHNGEYDLGKSEPAGLAGDPNLAYALELCQRGYITLAPDLEGFEERHETPEEHAHWSQPNFYPPINGDYERFIAMRYLQHGSTLQARYVWDMARAVDYLLTRPDVDAERIGVIGHSLGGQEACWALQFDPRIKVGVSSCGVGTFESFFEDGINHNFAAFQPGFLEVGDTDTFVASLAPPPFMMTTGISDRIFPISGVRKIGQKATESYQAAGAPEAYRLREFIGGHGCPPDVREEAYTWLDRWLSCRLSKD